MLNMMKAKGLAKFKPEIAEGILSGCREFSPWSDDYLECLVRHKSFTLYHPVGTCKMGPDPSSSVVDPELR